MKQAIENDSMIKQLFDKLSCAKFQLDLLMYKVSSDQQIFMNNQNQ